MGPGPPEGGWLLHRRTSDGPGRDRLTGVVIDPWRVRCLRWVGAAGSGVASP